MEIKLTTKERETILDSLVEMQLEYGPTTSWGAAYENLIDFAGRHEIETAEVKDLKAEKEVVGQYWPFFRRINIRAGDIAGMTETLAHEVGHLLAFKAGIFRKYLFEEELADSLAGVILEILLKA